MSSSTRVEKPVSVDASNVLCDKCKEPVVKPNDSTTPFSWLQGLQNLFASYFAAPESWPVGHILGSLYSPLHLERQMPKKHWRDAFENLLALETGGAMISLESRKKETEAAAELRLERGALQITRINDFIKRGVSSFKLAQEALKVTKEKGETSGIAWLERKIREARQRDGERIAFADHITAVVESRRGITGTQHKGRGQWIASLVANGPLRGWNGGVSNSPDGESWSMHRHERLTVEPFMLTLSEEQLRGHFEEGKPFEIQTLGPSIVDIEYALKMPKTEDLPEGYQDYEPVNEDGSKDSIFQPFTPAPPSVLGQSVMRVRYQGRDGSMVDRVVFEISYMDGKVEQKRIVDDSVEVLREVEKARASIEDRNLGF